MWPLSQRHLRDQEDPIQALLPAHHGAHGHLQRPYRFQVLQRLEESADLGAIPVHDRLLVWYPADFFLLRVHHLSDRLRRFPADQTVSDRGKDTKYRPDRE